MASMYSLFRDNSLRICFLQFLFGAKVHEVAELREKGPAHKLPLQCARVLGYTTSISTLKLAS